MNSDRLGIKYYRVKNKEGRYLFYDPVSVEYRWISAMHASILSKKEANDAAIALEAEVEEVIVILKRDLDFYKRAYYKLCGLSETAIDANME